MVNIHTDALHAVMQMHAALICIDVRFALENEDLPFPLRAHNIPWYGDDEDQAVGFNQAVLAVADLATPILVFCRNGSRSIEAARFLESQGFQTIYNLIDGCVNFAPRLIVDRYPRSRSDMQLFCV